MKRTWLSFAILALLSLVLALAVWAQEQDVTPPISASSPVDADGDGFITGAVLSATDAESGVKEIHFMVDGGEEQVAFGDTASLGPFSAEPGESKTVTLEYFAEDHADNTEEAHLEVHPVDACPDQSAIVNGVDRDADNDGCPETETNLCEEIAASSIDAGIRNSLWKKCLNAEDAYVRGRDNAGNNLLEALMNELAALRGQGVPAALADAWIARAQAVIVEHPE